MIDEIARYVAGSVGDVRPHEQRDVVFVAVTDAAGRGRDRRETGEGIVMAQEPLHVTVVLIVLTEAVLAVDLDALEVLLQDEVDDAGDRIRSVRG